MGFFLVLIIVFIGEESISPSLSFKIIISYSIAWLAGVIVVGSPGGIGVREAVLLLLLSQFIKTDILIPSILIHRGAFIVGEFLMFFLSTILLKRN
jgi:uncharacterized membrane protein YbhN (UPF0104 family)